MTPAEMALIQVSFLEVDSLQNKTKQKKNKKTKTKHTEYRGIFAPIQKSSLLKHGSPTFVLFGSWSLCFGNVT